MKIIKLGDKDWQERDDYFKKVLFEANNLKAGNFMIQEVKIKAGKKSKSHHHLKQIELFYAINNYGYFIVNDNKIELEIGNFLLVEPREIHTVANDSRNEFRFFTIKLEYNKEDTIID